MYKSSRVTKQLHCRLLKFYLAKMCAEMLYSIMKQGSCWPKPDTHFRHQLTKYILVDCRLVVQLCSCEDLIFSCQHVHWVLVQQKLYCLSFFLDVNCTEDLIQGCYIYYVNGTNRVGICHSRHSRRQCKSFASGVNFSRNNAIYNRNESTKYILYWFHL